MSSMQKSMEINENYIFQVEIQTCTFKRKKKDERGQEERGGGWSHYEFLSCMMKTGYGGRERELIDMAIIYLIIYFWKGCQEI